MKHRLRSRSSKAKRGLPSPYSYAEWEAMARKGVPADQKKGLEVETLGKAVRVVRVNFLDLANRRAERHSAELANAERETRRLYYLALANRAFGDEKLALKFMTRKHPGLGTSPIKKLDTEWGGRMVESILNSMMYGLPV